MSTTTTAPATTKAPANEAPPQKPDANPEGAAAQELADTPGSAGVFSNDMNMQNTSGMPDLDAPVEEPDDPSKQWFESPWPEHVKLPDGIDPKDYPNPGALIQKHVELNKLYGRQTGEIGSLRKQLKAVTEGKNNEALAQVWQQFNTDVAQNGAVSPETIEAITAHIPLEPSILTLFGEFMGQKVRSMREAVSGAVGGEDAADDFFAKLDESRFIPQHVKEAWHFQAMSGDTSWVPVAAQRLGIKVQQPTQPQQTTQQTQPGQQPTTAFSRTITQPTQQAPPDVFKTRQEFQLAYSEAIASMDQTKIDAVEEKMQRSIAGWSRA